MGPFIAPLWKLVYITQVFQTHDRYVVLCQSAVRTFLVTKNKVHQKKASKWEYLYYVGEILVTNSIISVHLISDVVLCQSAVRTFLVNKNKVYQKKACKWEYLYCIILGKF